LAIVHAIASGSDTRALWALLIYGGSLAAVGILLALRLFPADPKRPSHPVAASVAVLLLVELILWAALGPLRPGWNAIANDGRGTGQADATAGRTAGP
jgi:hypothetical protein